MKKTVFETAYEQPHCRILSLVVETSLMLTSSSVEDGDYEEEDIW